MEEVSLTIPVASEQSLPMTQPPAVNIPILTPPASAPVFPPPTSGPNFVFPDDKLQNMQSRVAALKSGQQIEIMVSAQALRKPYPGAPVNMPESSKVDVEIDAAKSQPRRITPIPISLPLNQPSIPDIQVRPIPILH